jgi:ankyrin repeat protein
LAAQSGHPKTIERLLEAGANLNVRDKEGQTPLYKAAKFGYSKTVEKLLDSGANPNLEDKDGKTALDVARTNKIRELLKRYAAKQ